MKGALELRLHADDRAFRWACVRLRVALWWLSIRVGLNRLRRRLRAAVLVAAVLLCAAGLSRAEGAPPPATDIEEAICEPPVLRSFVHAFMWKQVIWQGVGPAGAGASARRGDVWGGRLLGGLDLGPWGARARVDVSGLKDTFALDKSDTWQTLEAYASVHYAAVLGSAASSLALEVGPSAVVGSLTGFETGAPRQWAGINLSIAGIGARAAAAGSELHVYAAYTTFLSDGPKWRMVLVLHLRVAKKVYFVADVATGSRGFIRVGGAMEVF